MDALHWVLLIAAGAGSAGVVWILIGRGKLLARAQAAEASLVRADEACRRTAEDAARAEEESRRHSERAQDLTERAQGLELRVVELSKDLDQARADAADELRQADELHAARVTALEESQRQYREGTERQTAQLKETFASLAGKALSVTSADFLKLAREQFEKHSGAASAEIDKRREAVDRLVAPIGETLKKTEEKLREIDESRATSHAEMRSRIEDLGRAGAELRQETGKLVRALREPKVRGMYGEIQLKRVAELAGMREYCDFTEQETARDAEGNALRPDMIVRLPSGRTLAVDAKANLKPYLEALEATDPADVERHLQAFADGIARQASELARKEYWARFEGSPEFVVMFVPGDQFVDAALAKRPDLLDAAASQRVLLASPSTLIALLRAVHVGFQERRLADEARELRELGRELHERAAAAMEHVGRLGGALEKAVDHYNRFVASYESRLEPTLRKFEDSGVRGGKELVEVKPAAVRVRMPEGQGLLPGVEEPGADPAR